MALRTRLTVATVLLLGAATAACGGGDSSGAPTDASTEDFCSAQLSIMSDIDLGAGGDALPSEDAMADSIRSWADRIEEVGTPEGISEEVRQGFEETVKAARDVTAEDLKSPDLSGIEKDMSEEAKDQMEAFSTYVTDTCGSMFGDLELPEVG